MEEVSEIEVIQMEDSQIVVPASSALVDATSTASTAANSAVLPTATSAPGVVAEHFDDEEITFHKVASLSISIAQNHSVFAS